MKGIVVALALLGAMPSIAQVSPPPPSKSEIVFFRGRALSGRSISCAVHEGDQKVTRLPPGSFAALPIDAGPHAFTVGGGDRGTLTVDANAGETNYAECTVGMEGLVSRAHLRSSTKEAFMEAYPRLKPVGADK